MKVYRAALDRTDSHCDRRNDILSGQGWKGDVDLTRGWSLSGLNIGNRKAFARNANPHIRTISVVRKPRDPERQRVSRVEIDPARLPTVAVGETGDGQCVGLWRHVDRNHMRIARQAIANPHTNVMPASR